MLSRQPASIASSLRNKCGSISGRRVEQAHGLVVAGRPRLRLISCLQSGRAVLQPFLFGRHAHAKCRIVHAEQAVCERQDNLLGIRAGKQILGHDANTDLVFPDELERIDLAAVRQRAKQFDLGCDPAVGGEPCCGSGSDPGARLDGCRVVDFSARDGAAAGLVA